MATVRIERVTVTITAKSLDEAVEAARNLDADAGNPARQSRVTTNVYNHGSISGGQAVTSNVRGHPAIVVGPREALEAVEHLAEAVTAHLQGAERAAFEEKLDVLTQLIASPPSEPSTRARDVLSGVGKACEAVGGLAVAWQSWGPLLATFFGV